MTDVLGKITENASVLFDEAAPSEYTVPTYGAHDIEPTHNPGVWQPPSLVQITPAPQAGTDGTRNS